MSRERTREEVIELLTAASEDSFYAGLKAVQAGLDVSLLIELVARLGSAPLPELRRSERLAAILRKAAPSATDLRSIADAASRVSGVLANAVSPFLSPSARRRHAIHPVPELRAVASESGSAAATPGSTPDAEVCSTVLILSAAAQQDANIALLRDAGFSPFVYDTVAKLSADLETNADICGCIVDRSFLVTLSREEQEQLFDLLASYSTFIWLRVDDPGLKISNEAAQAIVRTRRLQTQAVSLLHMSMQPSGTIRQAELGALRRASEVLREYTHATFLPGELGEHERRLLVAAARDHGEQLRFDRTLKVEVVETKFVRGGQSQARLAIVRVNANGRAVVAKVDSKDAVRRELERFRLFVQPVDDQLQPFVCFHGSAAVVFFAFIPSEDDDSVAADTLQGRLQRFWCDEIFAQPTTTEFDNLCKALTNTATALARVNRQRSSQTHQALGRPDESLKFIAKFEAKGIAFGLPLALRDARAEAAKRFERLSTTGVVHGDFHLGNVLLRGDRSAHLIDFAASGPGHPAVDLVRLEMALFTGCWRPVDSEDNYVELQRALSVDGADATTLSNRFGLESGPILNQLCIHGCVEARRLALDVLRGFGGELSDYLAVKCLIAWQTLLMDNRQASLSRAVIRALG